MAYLWIATDGVNDVESLTGHCGVKASLKVPKLLVALYTIADDDMLNAVGHGLVRGLATPALGRLCSKGLRLLLLVQLSLGERHRMVRTGS